MKDLGCPRWLGWSWLLLLLLLSPGLSAKVTPEQAQRLLQDLTPIGAEREANEDGSIPAYTGAVLGAPATVDYRGSGQHYPDMYADERPLFWINHKNWQSYEELLSPGIQALIQRFAGSFRIPVYPSHRDARYSDFIHQNTYQNALRSDLIDGESVVGAFGGFPFPLPENGAQVIWNHLDHVAPFASQATYAQAAVFSNEELVFSKYRHAFRVPYLDPGNSLEEFSKSDLAAFFLQHTLEPSRDSGMIVLVHEYQNQSINPRTAWAYMPGARRVRRAPTVGYDNPSGAGGLRTDDERHGFNGAIDRYRWVLHGKKELLIPYHNYAFENPKLSYEQLMVAGHPPADLFRFEKHRVWVVEARLNRYSRHIYRKRFFFIDEDSWLVHLADNYDSKGQLWRTQMVTSLNAYDLPGVSSRAEMVFDLQSGAYVIDKLYNEEPKAMQVLSKPRPESYFTPANLRRLGGR